MSRLHFHEELEGLELDILAMGEHAERAVGKAVDALATRNAAEADEVIAGDDEIDEKYLSVEQRPLQLLALQTPVATDLRVISAL
ncbi:MAG: phosphate signaling complex PhoU family protein, partial [Actinomycetota bacterium]